MHIHRKLWRLVWPLILSNITVPLLGLVDTAVLGHLSSPTYLAAVALCASLFSFIFWAFGFLKMGTTGLAAQAWGRGQRDGIYQTLLQALVVALVIGCFIFANQWWLLPLGLSLMQTPENLLAEAQLYGAIRIYSAPAILLQYAIVGWLVGCQRTREALIIAVSTNVVNIVLDLVFVLKLGMRTDGVALATTIAEYYSVVLGLCLCTRQHLKEILHLLMSRQLWQLKQYVRLLKFNVDLFVRTVLLLLVFAFFTAQGARLGDEIVAANAVLLTFLLLISNALDGFANGAESLCGEAIGKGNRPQFHLAVKVTGFWSVVTATVLSLCFLILGEWIIALLTDIAAVRQNAKNYLLWLVVLPLLAVGAYWLDGVFIGAAKSKEMRNTILGSAVVVFLPVWWLSQPWLNHGLWFSLAAFMLARSVIQWFYFVGLSRGKHWIPES